MGIVLGSNFDVQTALPLDSRLIVADLTARDAIPDLVRYEGMIVYVVAEETNFQLVGGTTDGDWAELSGAGGAPEGDSSVIQTLADAAVITLAQVPCEVVKIKGNAAAVTVTLPNGTLPNQITYVRGDDNTNVPMIDDSGNVRSNGPKVYSKGVMFGYMWDITDSKWYQIGGW